MKQYWQRLAARIDGLTLRERAIIFAASALTLVVLVNVMLLEPRYAKQKEISQRIRQEQTQIAALRTAIQQRIAPRATNEDVVAEARLQQLRQQAEQMRTEMKNLGGGLISPDRMPSLLEDILQQHGKLRLVSLKTVPVNRLNDSSSAAKEEASGHQLKEEKSGLTNAQAIYRHGVEITVQGGYLDLLDYLAQLEAMPWQIFWGRAVLQVREYPQATLTLRLYTLSLDKKWLNI